MNSEKSDREKVLVGFYRAVDAAAAMLPNPARPQPFEEILLEIEYLMPVFYSGSSYTLFLHLAVRMDKVFGGKLVTPTELRNLLKGYEEEVFKDDPEEDNN